MSQVTDKLKGLLANTYALFLKSQNYHWHVTGVQFKPLHELFEEHYNDLFAAIDLIAERIRMLGDVAPANFTVLNQLKTLDDGNELSDAQTMVNELTEDHYTLISQLRECLTAASEKNDEVTVALMSDRLASHEKMAWFLKSSV